MSTKKSSGKPTQKDSGTRKSTEKNQVAKESDGDKSSSKKSMPRKSSARKTKRTRVSISKPTVKKGKVSLSSQKVLWLCCGIIGICLVLLIVTSIGEKRKSKSDIPSITERFEKSEEDKKSDDKKESETKTAQSATKSDDKGGKQSTPKPNEKDKKQSASKSDDKDKKQSASKQDSKNGKQTVTEPDIKEEKQSANKSNAQGEKQNTPKQDSQSGKQAAPKPDVKKENQSVAKSDENDKKQTTSKPDDKNKNQSIASNAQPQPKTSTEIAPAPKTPSTPSSFNFPQAVNHAELVFLFDDGGQNLNQLQPFLELPIPVTIAVLPKLPHSAESAARIRKSGNEVILHQPMQAINSAVNPGPGAIKPEMTALEIAELVQSNIDEIAPISGMNNHEGSLITADESKIGVVLDTAAKNGIFFLDSRTNVETKVPSVSKKYGYGWYERNGRFLDNEKTREEFLTELRKNLDIANKTGSVIMIAHIWSADYLPALIKEVYPELKAKGYTFKTVGESSARKY